VSRDKVANDIATHSLSRYAQLEAAIAEAYQHSIQDRSRAGGSAVARRPPGGSARDLVSPVSRKTFLNVRASTPCSPPSNTCSPRCITTGRSPIGVHHQFRTQRCRPVGRHQQMVRSDIGCERCGVYPGHRIGLPRGGVPSPRRYGLGETVVKRRHPMSSLSTRQPLAAGPPGHRAAVTWHQGHQTHLRERPRPTGRRHPHRGRSGIERLRFCLNRLHRLQDLAARQ